LAKYINGDMQPFIKVFSLENSNPIILEYDLYSENNNIVIGTIEDDSFIEIRELHTI
jgi:hypothetical protein